MRLLHRSFAGWIAILVGLLLAGCGGAAPRAATETEPEPDPLPEWRRGVFPPPDRRPVASPPPPAPADEAAVIAFFAEVAKVCPASDGSVESPGLSPAARLLPGPQGRIYRPLSWQEIQALERLLQATAHGDADRPRIIDRLAADYFLLEQELYRDCLAMNAKGPFSQKTLEEQKTELSRVREQLSKVRALGFERCAMLAAEYPGYTPATPCSAQGG